MRNRWKKQDCSWRRLAVSQAAEQAGIRKHWKYRLRRGLAKALAVEAVVLGVGAWGKSGMTFSVVRMKTEYQAEWVLPEPGEEQSGALIHVYGIRFDPEHMEIQFYHQSRVRPEL